MVFKSALWNSFSSGFIAPFSQIIQNQKNDLTNLSSCWNPLFIDLGRKDLPPVFSDCFQLTVLVWLPTLFFWLLTLPALLWTTRKRISTDNENGFSSPLPSSPISRAKMAFNVLLFLNAIAFFVKSFLLKGFDGLLLVWLSAAFLRAVTMLGVGFTYRMARRHGVITSAMLHSTWLLHAVCAVPELYARTLKLFLEGGHKLVFGTLDLNQIDLIAEFVLSLIWFLGCWTEALLHFRADPRQTVGTETEEEIARRRLLEENDQAGEEGEDGEGAPSPVLSASWFSILSMWWFNEIPMKGVRGTTLTFADIYALLPECRSAYLATRWEAEWTPAIEKYKRQLSKQRSSEQSSHHEVQNGGRSNGGGYQRLIEEERTRDEKRHPREPSISWALLRMFRVQLLTAAVVKLVGDLLQFANPLLLKLLIDYVGAEDDPLWKGSFYAFLLFLVMQIRSYLLGQYFQIMFVMGFLVQSVLQTAVFKKALQLSSPARRDYTSGEIVNLMAIDADRFQQITPQLPQFWSAPMQITLTLVYLFQTMGIAALPGVLIMIVFIPLSIFGSNFSRRWQREQMSLKDKRARLTGEMFAGARVVKLYAWEKALAAAIDRIREAELRCLGRAGLIRSLVDTLNNLSPFLVAIGSFLAYSLMGNQLTPQVAFVSLTLFNQLRFPMTIFGQLISYLPQWSVSNTRLRKFLIADELKTYALIGPSSIPSSVSNPVAVRIRNGNFSWDTEEPTLKAIDLTVNRGELLAIVGRVGSGKSSLLSAIIGEMEPVNTDTKVEVNGRIAYVSQTAWIQNETVRANILFGQSFDETFYWEVIQACALQPDLELLPAGDMTEIGERGINLSGGQKARLSLARAVYQRHCDVFLLDDTLSAVDAHVGRWLFDRVIGPNGILSGKTRLFATHGIGFLDRADRVVIIEDGKIAEIGAFSVISNTDSYRRVVSEKSDEEEEDEEEDVERGEAPAIASKQPTSDEERVKSPTRQRRSRKKTPTMREEEKAPKKAPQVRDELIKKEQVSMESVPWRIYLRYIREAGPKLYVWMPFFVVLNQALTTGRNFWLSNWSDDSARNGTSPAISLSIRLSVYSGFGFLEGITLFSYLLFVLYGGIQASKRLHTPQLERVLAAPLSFFETTPVGRLLNRFGKDVDVVDASLPMNMRFVINSGAQAVASLIAIIISVPVFLVVAVPLVGVYFMTVKYFVPTSRQLKRLESSHRSPVYSHFGETINGVSVIRAFQRTKDFCAEMERKLDRVQRIRYLILIANRWITIRLAFIGSCVVLFTAFFGVLHHEWAFVGTAGMIGLAVTYALNITDLLNVAVRQASDVESNIVSVERLTEYEDVPVESSSGINPPPNWPEQGHIRLEHYSARYRPELAPALSDINVEMGPAERVGIVGRTGAGKTTLSATLFRTLEHTEGRILVDSIDIETVALQELRSRLTIIPQDPTLFTGTLRFNLDPFGRHSDSDLWRALEMAHLNSVFSTNLEGLDYQIAESGTNLSVGQRQLLCLARALLRRSKIVIMDEATASVDLATDALVRDTVSTEFRQSTLLTIAHRLDTVIDYDRVMVLERGQIREFASPQSLIGDPNSAFSAMLESARRRTMSRSSTVED